MKKNLKLRALAWLLAGAMFFTGIPNVPAKVYADEVTEDVTTQETQAEATAETTTAAENLAETSQETTVSETTAPAEETIQENTADTSTASEETVPAQSETTVPDAPATTPETTVPDVPATTPDTTDVTPEETTDPVSADAETKETTVPEETTDITEETENSTETAETTTEETTTEETSETSEETTEETAEEIVITFTAEKGGKVALTSDKENASSTLELKLAEDEEAEEVVAIADEQFEFDHWEKDGEAIEGSEAITVAAEEASYVAYFKKTIEMPADTFYGAANGISVIVDVDEGTFPEGTVMSVKKVEEEEVIDAVKEAIDGEVANVNAVDITFSYEGEEIQPKKPVRVKMTKMGKVDDTKETKVLHIEESGEAAVVVESDEMVGAKAEFDAEHFSVYVIVDEGEDARLTVKFKNGETEIASMVVKKSDIDKQAADGTGSVFDQIIYDCGVGEIPENQVFRGWTDKDTYTLDDIDSGMTITGVRDAVKAKLNSGIEDGDEIVFNAMMFDVINVSFKDEDGIVLKGESLLTVNKTPVDYSVDETYIPKTSDQEFQGWYVTSGNTAKDSEGNVITDGSVVAEGAKITVSADTILSAKAPKGFWLIFKENRTGATYTAPQFLENVKPTEPTDPSCYGYTFRGWYTDAECTDGNEFDFDQVLESTTTVYAKWVSNETADYHVIIWKQNVEGNGYDFAESVAFKDGTVGEPINKVTERGEGDGKYARVDGVAKQWTGFHLDHYDKNVTIQSNGTSVVNVYYNRNMITLTFQIIRNNRLVTYEEMEGLYGSRLADNGYTWPEERWWYEDYQGTCGGYSGSGTRTTFMDAFILSDGGSEQTFYGFEGNGNRIIRFIKQNEDGTWPSTATNTVTASRSGTFLVSDKYNGYEAVEYRYKSSGCGGGRWSRWEQVSGKDEDGYYGRIDGGDEIEIRFAPLLYSIQYHDGIYVDGDNNTVEGYESRGELKVVDGVPYASNMASYNKGGKDYYEPTFSEFTFAGWYIDDTCTQPFTFTNMPEGLKVYAKWVQNEYRVFLHPNVPTSDASFDMGGQNTSFKVSSGESISQINGVRDDYELVGWYTDEACKKQFSFDAYTVNENTTNAYDKTRPTELDKYGDATSDENKDANRDWVTKCLDLYAKWRSKLIGAEGITVVYDAGDGKFADGKSEYTDPLFYKDTAGAVAAPASTAADTTKEEFEYWVIQEWNGSEFADTETTVYPGDGFEVLKSYTKQTEAEGHTEEEPKYVYTFKLRAEYRPLEEETLTHIIWYANNETDASKDDKDLHMNQALDIEPATLFNYAGHKFIGWARYEVGKKPASPTDTSQLWLIYDEENNKFTCDGEEAKQIACDEKNPYHDLYAVWKAGRKVTYKYTGDVPEGITPPAEKTYLPGESVTVEGAPSAVEGYTFEGWKIDGKDAADFTMPDKDVEITGNWTINKHKVTYKYTGPVPDGAPAVPAEATYNYGATVPAATVPTMEGYTFSGWTGEVTTMPDEDVEVTGSWTINSHKVTYKYTGPVPDGAPAVPEEKTYEYGATVPAAAVPTFDGYTFIGWEGEVATMPDNDVTVTGSWVESGDTPYTVEHYQENADGEYQLFETQKDLTGRTGAEVTAVPKSYDGYTFDDSVEGTKQSGTIARDGSLVLTLYYTRNSYEVSYQYTGKVPDGASELPKTEKYKWGTKVTVAGDATADGYKFSGWSETGSFEMPKKDVKITGSFKCIDISKDDFFTASQPEDVTYNGKEQKQKVTVTDKETKKELKEGTDYTIEYTAAKDAGTVTVTIKGAGDYTGTITRKYEIKKAPLTITTESAEKVYDGTPLTNDKYTVEGLVNGETIEVKVTGSQTEVGSSQNTVEITWAPSVKDIATRTYTGSIVASNRAATIGAGLSRVLLAVNDANGNAAKESNYDVTLKLGTLKVTAKSNPTPSNPSSETTPSVPAVPEEKMNIPVVKLWNDNNNAAGKRPASITVVLAADGQLTGATMVLSEANEWKGVFTDLPVWKAGNRIQYTILEDAVPGYVPAITGDKDSGFVLVNRLSTIPTASMATGDNSHMATNGLMMALSGLALAIYGLFYRKKKRA